MFFPNGLAGLYESHGKKLLSRLSMAGYRQRRAPLTAPTSDPKA
jgi:urea transport system permease protein